MDITKELARIQKVLKAPKDLRNEFAKFNYRSCEGILEAVKPLLGDCALTITDEILPAMTGLPITVTTVQNGNKQSVVVSDPNRIYVKATATLWLGDKFIKATAYAREEFSKKGMDSSQLTGATSSYARKYALNGLFCIDDNKDADTMDNSTTKQQDPFQAKSKAMLDKYSGQISEDQQLSAWVDACVADGFYKDLYNGLAQRFGN